MYTAHVFCPDSRAWHPCPDCDRKRMKDAVDAAEAEIGLPWKILSPRGIPVAHGDAHGKRRIAEMPLPVAEKLLLWVQREFNPAHVEKVYQGFVDVAAGNREGNPFERDALSRLFPGGL